LLSLQVLQHCTKPKRHHFPMRDFCETKADVPCQRFTAHPLKLTADGYSKQTDSRARAIIDKKQ
jgi:hypothetical protein